MPTPTPEQILMVARNEMGTRYFESELKNVVDVNKIFPDGTTLVFSAVEKGDLSALSLLIARGANLDIARTSDGETPACRAVVMGNADVLEILSNNGADLNKARHDGYGPAHLALENRTALALLQLLRDSDRADFNRITEAGETPAYLAARYGDRMALEFLAKVGADLDKACKDGKTPAYIVAVA